VYYTYAASAATGKIQILRIVQWVNMQIIMQKDP